MKIPLILMTCLLCSQVFATNKIVGICKKYSEQAGRIIQSYDPEQLTEEAWMSKACKTKYPGSNAGTFITVVVGDHGELLHTNTTIKNVTFE